MDDMVGEAGRVVNPCRLGPLTRWSEARESLAPKWAALEIFSFRACKLMVHVRLLIRLQSILAAAGYILDSKAGTSLAMRDTEISLRLRPEQRDLIDRAAALLGKNRSDFIREAACEKAQAVLFDQVLFGLDDEKLRAFSKLLDAPVEPSRGIERLMLVKAPWDQ